MTESIFGLTTHHLHMDQHTSPEEIPWRILRPSHTRAQAHSTPSQSRRTSYAPSSRPSSNRGSLMIGSRMTSPDPAYPDPHSQSDKRLSIATTSNSRFSTPVSLNGPIPYAIESLEQLSAPQVLLISGMENASSPARIKLGDILVKKRVEVNQSIEEDTLEDAGEEKRDSRKWPFKGLVIWVREEGAEIPSWLIDHFLCGVAISPDEVDAPTGDLGFGAIIPRSYIDNLHLLLPYTHIRPPLQIHISNLLSAVSLHPSLKATMTQRANRNFYDVVRAHRLLTGGFDLPPGWQNRLNVDGADGVNDPGSSPRTQMATGTGRFGLSGGRGGVDTWASLAGEEPSVRDLTREEDDWDGEDWYATPSNVSGVWSVCVRHRLTMRKERDEVMWLMKGSAGGGVDGKARSGGVDEILDELLRTV